MSGRIPEKAGFFRWEKMIMCELQGAKK